MAGPSVGTSAIFERVLADLQKTLPGVLDGKPWFDRLYAQKFSSFFHCMGQLLSLLDDAAATQNRCNDARILTCGQVSRLHSTLYEVARTNVRYLSPGVPGARDEYESCPLVVIYLAIASCVLFMRDFFVSDDEDYYHMCPQDIPYCVENGLNIVADIPIKNFSLQELTCSMMSVEQNVHNLTYDEALVRYVDALDIRVCDFLVHAMNDVAHNIESCRVQYRDTDLFTCATSTEFQLVVLIMSLRQLIETAAPLWRTASSCEEARDNDDDTLIATVRNKFIVEIQSVHSDVIEDKFYKEYTHQSIANSEGYLFFKANAISKRIEPGAIIRQFRTVPQWRYIADMAARPVVDFLFSPHADFLGFKLAFNLAAELIFSQTIKACWSDFAADGDAIRGMDATQFDTFIEESYSRPTILFLLNDACIFFRGQLTVFGRRHTDYYHALIQWAMIVRQHMNGEFRPCCSVMPLIAALFDTNVAPAASSVTDDEDVERREFRAPPPLPAGSAPMSVFFEKSRAKKEFELIREKIETRPQELDANSILGDTDETGFPQTCRSAW